MRRNIMGSLCGLVLLTTTLSACGAYTSAQQGSLGELPTAPPAPTYAPLPAEVVPAAPAIENPNKAPELFSSSFDTDLSQWQVVDVWMNATEKSKWEVKEGRVEQVTGPEGWPAVAPTALVTGDKTWSDYSITAQGYSWGNSVMGLVGRVNENGFYVVAVRPIGAEGGKTITLQRYDSKTEIFTQLAETSDKGWNLKQWTTLGLSFKGNTITATLDGVPVLEAQDDQFSSGQTGVYGFAEGMLTFDNVIVQQ
ncbi:hypothetical protein ACP8Y2_21020 [Herpetosiphon llansteffanensis]